MKLYSAENIYQFVQSNRKYLRSVGITGSIQSKTEFVHYLNAQIMRTNFLNDGIVLNVFGYYALGDDDDKQERTH